MKAGEYVFTKKVGKKHIPIWWKNYKFVPQAHFNTAKIPCKEKTPQGFDMGEKYSKIAASSYYILKAVFPAAYAAAEKHGCIIPGTIKCGREL